MNVVHRIPFLLACLLTFQTAGQNLAAEGIEARASVNPSPVMAGTLAEYVVTFEGTSRIPELLKPQVDGLEFSDQMGTSSFTRIVNGRTSIRTQASWGFRPTSQGTLTIPARVVRIDGQEVRIPAVTFRVIPMDEETRQRAFLRVDIPDGPFYVGEAIPIRVGLFARDDVNLTNIAFPESEGDAFIHTEFDNNPPRTRTRIEGRLYEAFVWDLVLTPIKTGPATLQFRQNISLQVSDPNDRFPSLFSLNRSRSESYTLASQPFETEILPLPGTNQPDSFQDAIGHFEVAAALSTRELQVGEPITLTLSLSGSGNFDRISPPSLPAWDNWRIYPPKVDFVPEDEAGLRGEKSFEYILIPQDSAITEIPEIRYATFDPASGSYETTVLEAEPVTVKPSEKPLQEAPVFAPSASAEAEKDSIVPDSLLPIRPDSGTLRTAMGALWKTVPFWIGNGLFALLFLGTWQIRQRRRRLSEDDRFARRHSAERKIRKALAQAREAANQGDAETFYESVRFILQERISHLSKRRVEAKTLVTSDCIAILQDAQVPDNLHETCHKLLNAADAFTFAGIAAHKENLLQMADEVASAATALNRHAK